ncbi:small multi-drug export protein [Bacillaceae bacterium W0354]
MTSIDYSRLKEGVGCEVIQIKLLVTYIAVFVFSAAPFFEAYFVIPLGVAGGLNMTLTLLIGLVGNILTIFLVAFFIDKFKNWREKRRKKKEEKEKKKNKRAERIFNKYGVPGLAFLGPLLVGSHLTTIFAVTMGGSRGAASFWVSLSITVWSVLFSLLIYYGFDFLGFENKQFIKEYLNVN